MPADLRLMFGWPRLFASVLDAVLAEERHSTGGSGQAALLTLMTYCYASNLLTSEDVEAACVDEADVAYIADGAIFPAAALRSFRRNHREQLEQCLQHLFSAALREGCGKECFDRIAPDLAQSGVREFARRRLGLAVVFDTAMSE